MKKITMTLGMLMLLTLNVYPQSVIIKPKIEKGHVVPDYIFHLLNAPITETKLSDYKGKIILLDFWATWCTSCIAKFPFLDSVQKANKEKLQVLLVNQDDLKADTLKVEKFLKRYLEKYPNFILPTIVKDSILPDHFPHRTIPHYVIIAPDGRYISTAKEPIHGDLIQQIHNGDYSKIIPKQEFLDFVPEQPLFKDGNGGQERQILQKSFFTSYLDGIPSAFRFYMDSAKNSSKLFVRNFPLFILYKHAYQVNVPFSYGVFEVKNENRFHFGSGEELKSHMFSYELQSYYRPRNEMLEVLKRDLFSYFGAKAKLEKRKVRCMIVSVDNPEAIIGSSAKSEDPDEIRYTVGDLVFQLNQQGRIPAFNGITSKVPIIIDLRSQDITTEKGLAEVLKKNNLKVKFEEREVNLFIIYEE